MNPEMTTVINGMYSLAQVIVLLFIVIDCIVFVNFSYREKLNLAYKDPKHGNMFDVILTRHAWSLLDWTIDHAGPDACSAVLIRFVEL